MLTQLEALKAMGIEVWVLKREEEEIVEKQSTSVLIEPDPGARQNSLDALNFRKQFSAESKTSTNAPLLAEKAVSPNVSSSPQFRFALLHYMTVGFCVSLSEMDELPRRIFDDIARFMGAHPKTMKQQIIEWPMLETSSIDQSLDAARQVVTQKFGLLPAKVIVMGYDLVPYFGPLEKALMETPVLVGSQSYLLIPSLSELKRSAQRKRELLALLNGWF